MSDPFLISGPALISFSGGRTSAYMLHRIVDAHRGHLPPDVHVAFANTGKEREETLRFVHECASRWGILVRWLEWRDTEVGFEEVGFNSASRNGEPFASLIAKRKYLPNAVTRFCTTALKVQTMGKFMRSLGYEHWDSAVGLRHDEGWRVLKALERNLQKKERWQTILPLAKALVTKPQVLAFWAHQSFDLHLRDHEGNCDLCFLKGRAKLEAIIRDGGADPAWWIAQEEATSERANKASGARFVTERSYASLAEEARRPSILDLLLDGDDFDTECGLHCGGEAA